MTEGSTPATTRSGVATALRFLAAARREFRLTERLAELDPERGLGPVLQIGAEIGYTISAEDLRAAYAHDWGLRRASYRRAAAPAEKDRSGEDDA